MTDEQKVELISRVEAEHGVHKLFIGLGIKEVSSRGKNTYCVCPFHEGADNTTAFNYSNGFGFCFTQCNKSYDLFDIVMKMNNCNFSEAAGFLASLIDMDIDMFCVGKVSEDSSVNREFLAQMRKIKQKKQTKQWKPIDKSIIQSFTPKLHKILRDEGFDDDVREYFELGFSQFGYLENRITIPIDYIDGTVVTVSGRTVLPEKDLTEQKIRRYQIWYDTEKTVTLYNISRAEPYTELTGELILVEGFKSVWRLHQWGIRNAVATMGSSLSEHQKKLILSLNCKVIVCGDRDEAGQLLNRQVKRMLGAFSDVEIMDMFMLKVPEHSSVDNITKEQFKFLYRNKK